MRPTRRLDRGGQPGGVDRLEARAAADEERRRLVHAARRREVARGLELGRDGGAVARGEDLVVVEARDGGGDAAELRVGRPARVLLALVVVGEVGDVPELVLPAGRLGDARRADRVGADEGERVELHADLAGADVLLARGSASRRSCSRGRTGTAGRRTRARGPGRLRVAEREALLRDALQQSTRGLRAGERADEDEAEPLDAVPPAAGARDGDEDRRRRRRRASTAPRRVKRRRRAVRAASACSRATRSGGPGRAAPSWWAWLWSWVPLVSCCSYRAPARRT